ncbi:uncharacterized protein [Physcomitrium patens]|uniref:uncharacterized protein isoform X1 n=1 Tax=Physcomitrium patens TaxID=3218 RepID=UPI00024ACC58
MVTNGSLRWAHTLICSRVDTTSQLDIVVHRYTRERNSCIETLVAETMHGNQFAEDALLVRLDVRGGFKIFSRLGTVSFARLGNCKSFLLLRPKGRQTHAPRAKRIAPIEETHAEEVLQNG